MKDQSRSEDVVQDLFVDLWRKRAQLTEVESFGAYLKRATQFKCFDQLRKDKRNPITENEIPTEIKHKGALSVEDEFISNEKIEHINAVINSLPEKGRIVFMMSRHDGMSYNEISQALDVSLKTVEYHMMKNLKYLRQALFSFLLFFMF